MLLGKLREVARRVEEDAVQEARIAEAEPHPSLYHTVYGRPAGSNYGTLAF